MQLFPILLIGVLLASDGGLAAGGPGLDGWIVAGIAWGPVLLVLGVAQVGVALYGRKLAGGAPQAISGADRLVRGARWLLLGLHAVAVLAFGWLGVVREAVGDRIIIDELLTIAPPLAGVLGTWWVYYPIDRRVREAVLVRRLDLGRAIFPPPARGRYVLAQARLHLLFLLVPILMILTAAEVIEMAVAPWQAQEWASWAGDAATLGTALGIVVVAPLISRVVLDVEPMPNGPLRDDLLEICRVHGVRVRQVLLWKTEGTMINAAVMGLTGHLRYVLLTDALLESMSRPQLQAVMAHEIGHIRRHHMPWLVASLFATVLAVTVLLIEAPVPAAEPKASVLADTWDQWVRLSSAGGAFVLALAAFGWISRRFERQADTFAAGHLSRPGDLADPSSPPRITAEAVGTVCSALETIVRIDAAGTKRPSWRHGSIAWRQAYLETIIGRPVATLPIDRQIRWIKGLAVAVLTLAVAYLTARGGQGHPGARGPEPLRPAVMDGTPLGWDDRRPDPGHGGALPWSPSPGCTGPATSSSAWMV
ncbi:MAG: M48 family metallopeptidase [Planctomycetota bacterium]|jgi:Zn-dependent protease with chaperone function